MKGQATMKTHATFVGLFFSALLLLGAGPWAPDARAQSITGAVSVIAGNTATLTISGLPTNTNNPLTTCTLESMNLSVFTVPDSVKQTELAGGGYSSTVSFKVSGVSPGTAWLEVTFSSVTTSLLCRVTVTDPDLTFTPNPAVVDPGDTIPVTITRPVSEADAPLIVTFARHDGCVVGLKSTPELSYDGEAAAIFGRLQESMTIYITGLAYREAGASDVIDAYVDGDLVGSFTVQVAPYTYPVASPLTVDLVAGNTFVLNVSNLPIPTNSVPTQLHYFNEDSTRIFVTNYFKQPLFDETRYYDTLRVAVQGIQRINNLFEPVPINVSAVMDFGDINGYCEPDVIGTYWTNRIYVFPKDPTFDIIKPSVVRVGDTYPLVIRRTAMQSQANLYFTLYSDDERVLGLGTDSSTLQTNKSIRVMFEPVQWSKTVYISGLSLTANMSTNIKVTAQVGSYLTNTFILVSTNGGLVLSPLNPELVAGDTLSMTVSRPSATNVSDLTVYLSSENPQVITVPEYIVIPAGAQSASFAATALLPGSSTIRATAVGVPEGADCTRTVQVMAPNLTFAPNPASNVVDEVRLVGISRPFNEAGADLQVDLSVLTPGLFTLLTNQVVIPAGQLTAYFGIIGAAEGEGYMAARVGYYNTNLLVVVGLGRNDDDPDNDGVPTETEMLYGWDPYDAFSQDPARILNDGDYDSDNDGLSNRNEIDNYGTHPLRQDTDDDGIKDGEEVSLDLTNPLHPMSSRDYYERSLNLSLVPASGLTIPNSQRFAFGTNGWTVEHWVRPGSDGNGQVVKLGMNGTNTGFWVGLENYRPKVEIVMGTNVLTSAGGTNSTGVGDIQQIPANEWSHLAYVWAPNRNSLEVYVNGVLLIARETLAAPSFQSSTAILAQNFTDGYIDDVRIWGYDRSWDELTYWRNRIFPAPSGYVQTPSYGNSLALYYRFDDGTTNIVDFAHLNDYNYFIVNSSVLTTTNPAVSLIGADDEDGDLIPEWWTRMHTLDSYPEQVIEGPEFKYLDDKILYLARIDYFRTFRAYGSIGTALSSKNLGPDLTDNLYHDPVDTSLAFDGRYSTFMKYTYLYQTPLSATLRLFTPGMTTTVAYVNGQRVTPVGDETNNYQVIDLTSRMRVGRNMVYVRCESYVNFYLDEARTKIVVNPDRVVFYEGAYGKFDASLVCDGKPLIVRGDYTHNDPRSVWYGQTWSTFRHLGREENHLGDPVKPDKEGRSVPGNQDYGLPFDADTDSFNAYYEYFCGTNPRDNDSNNNGVPDDLEDFDGDGLCNGDEQRRGSNPLLRDTDDDGLVDGLDAIGDNDPASAMSPLNTRSMSLSGAAGDYVEMPREKRFALSDWTVEAWVQRDPSEADGGVLVDRQVGPNGVNYELGLGDGSGQNAALNVPYIKFVSVDGVQVVATNVSAVGTEWTHVAGSYDSSRRILKLYVNGVLVDSKSDLKSPAIYAGGPVNQRVGQRLHGRIDEVRIWNKARSDVDIVTTYGTTVPASDTSLIAYYRFDDNTSYTTNPALIGTSANNWTNVMPWTWGQVQDYVKTYNGDWWEKWTHAATLKGSASFTTNGGGALDNPPSLLVNLLPSAVVDAGAQWRVSGFGDWYNSGVTLSDGLNPGNQTVTFKVIPGWTAPADVNVILSNNSKTVVSAEYTQNGAIRVDITPPDAVTAGAFWRVDGGSWNASGVTVGNLSAVPHLVEFSSIMGWNSPIATNLVVQPGLTTTYIASYSNVAGSVQVFLNPEIALTNGAAWRIDGGAWRTSGDIAFGLSFGAHTISFNNAFPWISPSNMTLSLNNSETVILDITYELLNGGLNDTDADGLTDLDEITNYGTDPLRRDTDEDGVMDGTEVIDISDPVHPMSSTNYAERSMNLAVAPSGGFSLPLQDRFYFSTNGWTVEYWIRPGSDGNGEVFALDGMNGLARSGLWAGLENFRPKSEIYSGSNAVVLASVGGTNDNPSVGDIQQLPQNAWSHVAHVWSPERNSFELYINGVLLIAQETPVAPNFDGGHAYFARGFSNGHIDDVRIWNYDRTREEVSYWFSRIFPAPAGYVHVPDTRTAMVLYYRFDNGGTNVNDFAHLNRSDYFISGAAGLMVSNQAISLLGYDDEDGDQLPEWWVKVHNLDKYPQLNRGPRAIWALVKDCFYSSVHDEVYTNYFDANLDYAAHVEYFRTFRAYGSIGAPNTAWLDPVDNMYYTPKDTSLGFDGRYSTFMKYIMLDHLPKVATLKLFVPGMVSTRAYVNGHEVASSVDSNSYLSVDVAQQLRVGRNMVFVQCESGFNKYLNYERTDMANPSYKCNHFEGAYGKFDASLDCDGVSVIKRGDHSRNDPRAVWICQAWSTHEELGWDPPVADQEQRAIPGNQDYGLPFDADTDGLNAIYEFYCGTNPRDDDSNNNGVPDGLEDYENDGLNNGEEQSRGADPTLPDTDDDGVWDGLDAVGDNNPASALVPLMSRALTFGGTTNDYVEFPVQSRFALTNWTVEAWVQPLAANGGTIIQRKVSPVGVNFELGLLTNNVPYVRFVSVDGHTVQATAGSMLPVDAWTHLAGTYDGARRILTLYVNGMSGATAPSALKPPAMIAGGAVIQRVGERFQGRIDEVRIWNITRTAANIQTAYPSTVPVSEIGLAAYYRFDDNTSFTNGAPTIGTSANNWRSQLPWTWGQVQDYTKAYESDWWSKWLNSATLKGNVFFTSGGGGVLDTPPILQVMIYPQQANDDGAQWRLDTAPSWYDSGYSLSDGLTPGPYTIMFQNIPGWTAPMDMEIILSNNMKTVVSAEYTQNGGLRVDLVPDDAVNAGAQWRVDGGAWNNSGATVNNLAASPHLVEFSDVVGWTTPTPTNLVVLPGQTTFYMASYSNVAGSVQVYISPEVALTNGARWRIDGGAWHGNGDLVSGLQFGLHTISFQHAFPWIAPSNIVLNLNNSDTAIIDVTYQLLNGGANDEDNDGLPDIDEVLIYKTDPLYADTDEDGVVDGTEVTDITDPLHPMSSRNYVERSLNCALAATNSFRVPYPERFYVGTNGWTVEYWIRPGADGHGRIFALSPTGSLARAGFWVGLENFRPKGAIFNGTNSAVLVSAGGTNVNTSLGDIQQLPQNVWSHVAHVWAPERNSFEVYINGVLLIAQETPVEADFSSGAAYFAQDLANGYVDEVRVWNYDRTREEVSYWFNRIFPAPSSYVMTPSYGTTLALYYRFDNGGTNVNDFAKLNNRDYYITGASGMMASNQAICLLGNDDEDGDLLPEWWVKVHNLDKYPDDNRGPTPIRGAATDCNGGTSTNSIYFDEALEWDAHIEFLRTFRAYGSIGAPGWSWYDPIDNMYYEAKNTTLGFDGRYSTYMKYVMIDQVPKTATLQVFTPGMVSTKAYINGQLVTSESQMSNTYQSINVAQYLKVGRNMVYVRCESGFNKYLDYERRNMVNPDYNCNFFEGVYGKFDAALTCDGVSMIVRGDHSRNDPRAVWVCQAWSTHDEMEWDPPVPDVESRALPGNQDYGLPFDADTDNLNARYEFFSGTNPRDDDSNNNGIPDGLEDFDDDGLSNGEEQSRASDPTLPDSDDDGVLDGADSAAENNPASALVPMMSRAMSLGGSTNDYVEFPIQSRFQLSSWTLESWVRPASSNGGCIIQRKVSPQGVNFELGLATNNTPYVRFVSLDGYTVSASSSTRLPSGGWSHLAGSYDGARRILTLYINGTNSAMLSSATEPPAIIAGGPVVQRIGAGFQGLVDEVRIWSEARTAAQIHSNFPNTVSVSESALVAYYRFDDSTSYSTNPTPVGTSVNNWRRGLPWSWGQVQDYAKVFETDWWNKWLSSATLHGNVSFSSGGGGALYTPPILQVTIYPPSAVGAGAQWRLSSQASWFDSDYNMSDGLVAGTNRIVFKTVEGWITPADVLVVLSNNVKTTVTVQYQRNGTLNVMLAPPEALAAGAQWRIENGEWRNSGDMLENLTPGAYYVECKEIVGWSTPQSTTLQVSSGETNTYLFNYEQRPTGIRVTLTPNEAIQTGAQWRINSGPWQNSGSLVLLSNGTYTIEYQNLIGWLRPLQMSTNVINGNTTSLTGRYFRIQIWDAPGTNVGGGFNRPRGMAFDSRRRLYIADSLNNRVLMVNTLSNNAWSSVGVVGQFNQPMDVYVDAADNLYVADTGNNRIQKRFATTMAWSNWAGFSMPFSVAVAPDGTMYVADTGNNRVLKKAANNNTWSIFMRSDSSNEACTVIAPQDIVIDQAGYLYVADAPAGKARIRKVSPEGTCYDVVGSDDGAEGGFSVVNAMTIDFRNNVLLAADRIPGMIKSCPMSRLDWSILIGTECLLNFPEGLSVDEIGNMYISDTFNNRIIRLTIETGLVQTPRMASMSMSSGAIPPGPSNGLFNLQWMGQDHVFYNVEYTDCLMPAGPWLPLRWQIPGSNALMNCVDTNASVTNRFYRITAF
jgi:hypothetical protein